MYNGFIVTMSSDGGLYCWISVVIDHVKSDSDEYLADLLDMSIHKYTALVKSFGGYYNTEIGLVFDSRNRAQNFVDYLNETYLLVLKLQEKI